MKRILKGEIKIQSPGIYRGTWTRGSTTTKHSSSLGNPRRSKSVWNF